MSRRLIAGFIISAFIMLGLPLMAVAFVRPQAGMAVMWLMFLGINPLWSIAAGIMAGFDVRRLWALPVVTALLFVAGAWGVLKMAEGAFVTLGLAYLGVGLIFMVTVHFILRKIKYR